MIVNGVTLPDLPDGVLDQYPYAIIFHSNSTGYDAYVAVCVTSPFEHLSPGMDPAIGEAYLSRGTAASYLFMPDIHDDWELLGSEAPGPLCAPVSANDYTVVWTNQESFEEVLWVDEETGEWGTEPREEAPDRVSIGRSLMNKITNEVQRLTGTTDQMNAVTIQEQLSNVHTGIKIGDVVLPAIPEDVLAEYPYVVILHTNASGDESYTYHVMNAETVYLNGAIVGSSYEELIGCTGTGVGYLFRPGNTALHDNGNIAANAMDAIGNPMSDMTVTLIWANHDVYEVTNVDTSTGEFTYGDIYFSERQNFNGVWLPKIPADAVANKPYQVSLEATVSGVHAYSILLASTSEFGFADVDVAATLGFDRGIVSSFGTGAVYVLTDAMSEWGTHTETVEYPYSKLGVIDETEVSLIWSNHDVYEVTSIDTSTMTYTTGDLYFPPLEPIDSDRVSIGYDLFNSIVKEIQRLSSTDDKMDARHALYKLTTVEA